MNRLEADSSLSDVAFAVYTALEHSGEYAVLCGGSAATYYAPEAYQSRDLDFVLRFSAQARTIDDALRPLGYERTPERLYRHPTIMYTVEFPAGRSPSGPRPSTHLRPKCAVNSIFTSIHRTDVVRDRFMHYWAWGDQVALQVALDVAAAQSAVIDRAPITAWTERELARDGVYDRKRRDHFLGEIRRVLG